MSVHRDEPRHAAVKVDEKQGSRVRGHLGSKPRGNPPLNRRDLERSVEKLGRVLGG